jgi:hypothetical protein
MFTPEFLAGMGAFIRVCSLKRRYGISLVRVRAHDAVRCGQDPECRRYTEWLRALLCRQNVVWGGEDVHEVPLEAFVSAGIELPVNDVALYGMYGGFRLLESRYRAGRLCLRTFYDEDRHPSEVAGARELLALTTELIAGGDYRLAPVAPPIPYPWPQRPLIPC